MWASTLILLLVLSAMPSRCQHKFDDPQEVSCGPGINDYCTCHMTPELMVTCQHIGDLTTWPDFPDYIIDVNTEVEVLVLSDNSLQWLPSHAFGSLLLQSLDLSENHLTNDYIAEDALTEEQAIFLESLDLSDNSFNSFPDFVRNLTSLRYLDLTRNVGLTVITKEDLEHLRSLEEIHLPYIWDIEDGALAPITSLKVLTLAPLAYTSPGLQVANIFGSRNIESLRDLETLILYSGVFKIGGHGLIDHLPNLKHLEMIDSELQYYNIYNLSVSENNVIDTLSLAHNEFTRVPVDFTRNLHRLEHLDLSINKLRRIRKQDFKRNSRLIYLDLKDNRIALIRGKPFRYLNELVELNLSGNQLSAVSEAAFPRHLMDGMVLSLSHNPLACGCDIWWLMVVAHRQMGGQPGPLLPFEIANELECSILLNTIALYEAYELWVDADLCD